MSWFAILKNDDGDFETDWNYDRRKEEKLRAKKRMDEGVHAKTSTNFLNDKNNWLGTIRHNRNTFNTGHTPKPLKEYNTSETMLFDIFNVPIEALGQLVIPENLVINLKRESNLDKLDEQKFNELMQLSDKREYQELVDKLTEIFNIRLTQNDMRARAWKDLK